MEERSGGCGALSSDAAIIYAEPDLITQIIMRCSKMNIYSIMNSAHKICYEDCVDKYSEGRVSFPIVTDV